MLFDHCKATSVYKFASDCFDVMDILQTDGCDQVVHNPGTFVHPNCLAEDVETLFLLLRVQALAGLSQKNSITCRIPNTLPFRADSGRNFARPLLFCMQSLSFVLTAGLQEPDLHSHIA